MGESMNITKEELQQCLYALKQATVYTPNYELKSQVERHRKAISLLQSKLAEPEEGSWYDAKSIDAMVRDLDIAMNGDNAAPQAMLCDLMPTLIARLTEKDDAEPVGYLLTYVSNGRTTLRKTRPTQWERPSWKYEPVFTHPAKQTPMTDVSCRSQTEATTSSN